LQPAKVSRVSITDLTEKQLEVIVDDTQLSLAIGKKGQNVRLAAKLLGWKIDIKSEEEKRQEVEQQMQALAGAPTTPIEQVTELGDGIIQKLVTAGITTVEGTGRHDAGAARRDSGHRRKDAGEDFRGRAPLLRPV
jgi:transcription termination/antitermination protein NusA